jgi:hypothetical protein
MIVRDEEAVIERCLTSARGLIDSWVICDTGSSDATPALVQGTLAGIPGELHHHRWRDFASNRSALLRLARGRADYLLLMDADWTIEATAGAFDGLTADAYMVRHAGPTEFHNKRLVSGRIPWRYVGATHEYITSDAERTCERLEGVTLHVHEIGGERTGRWEHDIALLRAALERDPADARSTFYLAQTLRDLGHSRADTALLAKAREGYELRATLPGWDEETYCARHEAGALAAELGDWPAAVEHYVAAWEARPQRLESVFDLVLGLRQRERWHTALRFTSLAGDMRPLPEPADNLHVAPWVYRWGLLFEHSIACYWTDRFTTCIAACDVLLARDDLPDEHREQTRRNRDLALAAEAERIGRRALDYGSAT